ncbi:DUF1440 domain-containing protein [Deminuibacter soli]|uniref:DUF1440 domain-containing protein n=1 Tax=Deminuibacter soli TaxID=2291815 RepID=A0A3E1NK19_9BACT|nr:DUF1440 domain-containing protein [Deminuibacter soli]RFM28279.1 DUF1440 domain-containing protein [Deminuibacter soli]
MQTNTKTVFYSTFITGILIAGTLDVTAAIVVYGYLANAQAFKILHSIASVLIGPSAFTGGWGTALLGLAIHFFIAACFTLLFIRLYNRSSWLRHNKTIGGLAYGSLVWCIMNLIVLPVFQHKMAHFTVESIAIGMAILMCCIGLPLAYITDYHVRKSITGEASSVHQKLA